MNKPASSLKNILSRGFPGINLINLSLVEDSNPEPYRSKYFSFLKGIPGEQSSTSPTGRTYNYQNGVNFKLEIEKLLGLSSALKFYAEGKGEHYETTFGNFEIHADSSRSAYGSSDGSKKSLKVGQVVNNKSGKKVILLTFIEGTKKAIGYFTPYDAMGFSKLLDFCANHLLRLEASRQHEVVVPQTSFSATSSPPSTDSMTSFNSDFPQNEQTAIGDFQQIFNSNGMDPMPY